MIKKKKIKINLHHNKKRLMKAIKFMRKRTKNTENALNNKKGSYFNDMIQQDSENKSNGLKNYSFNGLHPEFNALCDYEWIGLMTLKFYSYSHSKDDHNSHKSRLIYVTEFMNNIRLKLGVTVKWSRKSEPEVC